MAATLQPEEKVRCRHHTGYLNVQEAQTFVLGIPAGVQTQFIIEGAMNRLLEEALPQFRRHLTILDAIEEQMVSDMELLAINKIGNIEINEKEQAKLREQYTYWRDSLCNLLGIQANPFDKRFANAGVNVGVQH